MREGVTNQPFIPTKVEPPKVKVETFTGVKGKFDSQPKHTREFKCFSSQEFGQHVSECPNKRIMVMIDNGDVEFESDKSDCEDMPPLKECAEDEVALPIEESLVIRRTLQVQVNKD